jgi:hypothetical protein
MKPQQQKIKKPGGDCLRACIATLLDYPIDSVPNFVEAPAPEDPNCPFPGFWLALQSWLSDRGLWFLEMALHEKTPWMPIPLPALAIALGETAAGVKHAVVVRLDEAAFVPVFNPWPEAEIVGVGSLGFLIPRDPATVINLGKCIERVGKLAIALPAAPISDSIRQECAKALQLETLDASKIISATFDFFKDAKTGQN